jgi:hypothetical protein
LKRKIKVGGADGIRTHDLLDAIEARSQLRHGPTEGMPKVYHSRRKAFSLSPTFFHVILRPPGKYHPSNTCR